jgi:hypothetical protein
MSVRFTGDKTALRRTVNLPSAHDAFTICGFAKLLVAAPSREAHIVYTQNSGASSAQTVLLAGASGTALRAGDNYNDTFTSDVATVTAGGSSGDNWFFFAVVGLAAGANGMRLYHGAPNSGSLTYAAVTNTPGATGFAALQFGDLPFGSTYWFDGLLAHLKIYNRALSEAEVTAEAGQAAPASASGLISYHAFSDSDIAVAVVPDTGSGTFTYFTSAPSTSADMPTFSATPTLTGEDTLPSLTGVPPSIQTTTLPNGAVGEAYLTTLSVTGDQPITWSVSSGSVPGGLTLNASSGVLSGTPTTAATTSFTASATNAVGVASAALSVTIASVVTVPVITTTTLPSGVINEAYAQTVSATGTAPITWSVAAGALPAGLAINASTGAISGTPTTSGTQSFTIGATNAAGVDSQAFTVTIEQPRPPTEADGWTRLPRDIEIWVRIPRA